MFEVSWNGLIKCAYFVAFPAFFSREMNNTQNFLLNQLAIKNLRYLSSQIFVAGKINTNNTDQKLTCVFQFTYSTFHFTFYTDNKFFTPLKFEAGNKKITSTGFYVRLSFIFGLMPLWFYYTSHKLSSM
jgi:hypothetical protein